MKKKVRFMEKVKVLVLTNTKEEDLWRRTKIKTIGYIRYKSRTEFEELMQDNEYRTEYYNKKNRISIHRYKVLHSLSNT